MENIRNVSMIVKCLDFTWFGSVIDELLYSELCIHAVDNPVHVTILLINMYDQTAG